MLAEYVFGIFLTALGLGGLAPHHQVDMPPPAATVIAPAVMKTGDAIVKLIEATDLGCPIYDDEYGEGDSYSHRHDEYDDCYREYKSKPYRQDRRHGYYDDDRYSRKYEKHYGYKKYYGDNDYHGPRYGDRYPRKHHYKDHSYKDDDDYGRSYKHYKDDEGYGSSYKDYKDDDYYHRKRRSYYHPSHYRSDSRGGRSCGLLCWLNKLAYEDLPLSDAYYRPDCGYDCERRHMRRYCERHSWQDPSGCWHCPTGCHGLYRPCRNWRCHF